MNSNQPVQNSSFLSKNRKYDDGVSLVYIADTLLHSKKLVLGITLAVFCTGLFYAFTTKRVYQVETILFPPSSENTQALNVWKGSQISTNDVFSTFNNIVKSRRLKKEFFEQSNIIEKLIENPEDNLSPKVVAGVFNGFSQSFNVTSDENSKSILITLDGVHKEKIGIWLDDLVMKANQETINQLVRNLQAEIDAKINSIKIEISSKRSVYKKRVEDELTSLQEAYQIAESLGIHEHLFLPNVGTAVIPDQTISSELTSDSNELTSISNELTRISNKLSNSNNFSMYMKGTKVLKAEIHALKNRKSNDSLIGGLRNLQEVFIGLKELKIDKGQIQTVIVDKKAAANIQLISPNRRLIIIISLILGGMLGVFSVIILNAINHFNNRLDTTPNTDEI